MRPFDLESEASAQGAIDAALRSSRSRFIAGGTNLVDLMKLHVEEPDLVVDINGLRLGEIRETPTGLAIGAMVTNTDLAQNSAVKKHFPMLSEAILSGASPQLRNMATTGGNILQRTRCTYFRDTACACNKREPGTGCSAIDGFNRQHAVLGGSQLCIATHPSDMTVALAALDAVITTLAPGSKARSIPLTEFYREPGKTPHIENVLGPGELITGVEIPRKPWFTHSTYVKVRDRASYSFALVSAGVALDLGPGRVVRESRIAFGGVGTVPWRSKAAEGALNGKELTPENIRLAGNAAMAGAKEFRYNGFKIELAKRVLERAILQVGSQAGGRA